MGERESKKQWDAENTERVSLKLNKNTDADIIKALDNTPKQTEIKRLVREALESAKSMTQKSADRELNAMTQERYIAFTKLLRAYMKFDAIDKAAVLAFATAIQNGSTVEEARQIANDIRRSNGKADIESWE